MSERRARLRCRDDQAVEPSADVGRAESSYVYKMTRRRCRCVRECCAAGSGSEGEVSAAKSVVVLSTGVAYDLA
jgi:hypothetical protein